MKTNKSYKFRLYPTEEQTKKLVQCGGNTRFLWNYFLDLNQKYYKKTKNLYLHMNLLTYYLT